MVEKTKTTSDDANDALEAWRATQLAICSNPALLENEYFLALQDAAYARVRLAFKNWDGV